METYAAWQTEGAASRVFDIGTVHVAVFPAGKDRLAHFLLYRTDPATRTRVLIRSGSTHDTASCIEQATSAAHRAEPFQ